jgi:hypothetical protein
VERKRISRRAFLRTIAIAGPVGWSAPVLTGRPASASIERCTRERSRRLRRGQPLGNCMSGFGQCGTCNGDVGDGSWCFEDTRSRNISAEDVFCAEAGRCAGDADCKRRASATSASRPMGAPRAGMTLRSARRDAARAWLGRVRASNRVAWENGVRPLNGFEINHRWNRRRRISVPDQPFESTRPDETVRTVSYS